MPRNFFSRSHSTQSPSPSLPEPLSSSGPPQEKALSPPSDNDSLSNVDEILFESPLPNQCSPWIKSTSEGSSLPEKKSAWNSIPKMMLWNRSSTQASTDASNESLERPLTPNTTTSHETELHSRPSSPTATPSTSRSRKSKSKHKYGVTSYRREKKSSEPAHRMEASEGESVASRHKIGSASIDCEFYKIEYGQFKGRPACLIIVDVRLVYPPDNTIDKVKLEFQFAKDGEQNLPSEDLDFAQNKNNPISKVFAPEMIEGMPKHTTKLTHHDIKPKIECLSFKVDTGGGGGQTTATKEYRWRVLGRREEHNGIYDTFGWNIFQNEVSDDSVPRQVRLGMIAFHQHQPFSVNVNIEGGTRQKHRRPKATHETRWFNPPNAEDVGRHILQEAMVENLVSKQNLLIRDIAQSRVLEGKTANLMDLVEFGAGAGSRIDGGGVIEDLLTIGDMALTAECATTETNSNFCN